jgi:hypothetical protein
MVVSNSNGLAGQGTLDPSLSTCGASGGGLSGINCGSFGSTPFYQLSFQSGQLNNFSPAGRQVINGSLDVAFGNNVPEPASIALLGLGWAWSVWA